MVKTFICPDLADLDALPQNRFSAKYLQILDGARAIFLERGFDGASMNDVAQAAGVSKATLYVYFSSKHVLFETLIIHDRQHQAERICKFDLNDSDLERSLRQFGRSLVQAMLEPTHIAFLRMLLGAINKFPAIGKISYDNGPGYAIDCLAGYLAAQGRACGLKISDTRLAAQQFIDLCLSAVFKPVLYGVEQAPDAQAIDRSIALSLRMFMAAYKDDSLEPDDMSMKSHPALSL